MLPVLNTVFAEKTLPISKKKVKIRPYLVGEEKMLLMAAESKDDVMMINAIKNLLKSCLLTEGIEINELNSVDLEYLFLQIRIISADPIVTIGIRHKNNKNCEHVQQVEINLNNVVVEGKNENKIYLTEDVGLIMKIPTNDVIEKVNKKSLTEIEKGFELLKYSIEYIFDKETVTDVKEISPENLDTWINTFNRTQLEKIMNFFNSIPHLKIDVEYVCDKCGEHEKLELRGIQNFLA